jgi:hypothetical protein
MKVRKNLEGVFLVATAMTILATYASAMPVPHFKHAPAAIVSASQPMATVVVTGHRLTAAEKAAAQ